MKLDWWIGPGSKRQSKIVQPTAGFQDRVPKAGLPTADLVLDHAIAFDPTDGVLNSDPDACQPLIDVLVQVRQGLPPGFLLGLQDGHIVQGKALKAAILEQLAVGREVIIGFIGQSLVVFLALNGFTQKADLAAQIGQNIVLEPVPFFFPLKCNRCCSASTGRGIGRSVPS